MSRELKQSTIYLMRHGRTVNSGQMVGRMDYPLSQAGQTEMLAWARYFAPIPISAVWCSPLERARQSARIVTSKLTRAINPENFHDEPGLIEVSLGEWEGLGKAEVQEKYPQEWKARGQDFMGSAPPGGESFAQLAERVTKAFTSTYPNIIEHSHVIVMAHQAVNRALLAALGEPFTHSWFDIPQGCGALNELELTRKRTGSFSCKIIRVNARPPLWLR